MAETGTGDEPRITRANKIVMNHAIIGAASGLVPVPWVDMAVLTGIQLKMVHSLARLYEVEFSRQIGKSLLASLAGAGASAGIASYLIPVVGRIVSTANQVLTSAASTYAVGRVFILHFDSGGTLLEFDAEKLRAYYTAELAAGKAWISESFAGVRP